MTGVNSSALAPLIDHYNLHIPEHWLNCCWHLIYSLNVFLLNDQTRAFRMASIVCARCLKIYAGDVKSLQQLCRVSRLPRQTRWALGRFVICRSQSFCLFLSVHIPKDLVDFIESSALCVGGKKKKDGRLRALCIVRWVTVHQRCASCVIACVVPRLVTANAKIFWGRDLCPSVEG